MAEAVNSSLENIEVADEDEYVPETEHLQPNAAHPQHRVRIVTTKGRGGPIRDLLGKPVPDFPMLYQRRPDDLPSLEPYEQVVAYENYPHYENGGFVMNNQTPGTPGEHPVFRISLPANSQQMSRLSTGSGTVRIVKISKPLADQSYKNNPQHFVRDSISYGGEEEDYIDSNELVEDVRSGSMLHSPFKRKRKTSEERKKDDVLIILDGQPSSVQKKRGPGRKPKGQGDERELTEPLPPPRSYQQRKPANKEDLGEYIKWRERRDRNNDAVRRTRVKKRQRELEMEIRVDHLTRQKEKLETQLKDAYKEMRGMREILREIKDGKSVEIPEQLTEPIPDSVIDELLYMEPLPPMQTEMSDVSTDERERRHDEDERMLKMESANIVDPQLEPEEDEEEMVERPIPGVAEEKTASSASGRPVREARNRKKKFPDM